MVRLDRRLLSPAQLLLGSAGFGRERGITLVGKALRCRGTCFGSGMPPGLLDPRGEAAADRIGRRS